MCETKDSYKEREAAAWLALVEAALDYCSVAARDIEMITDELVSSVIDNYRRESE